MIRLLKKIYSRWINLLFNFFDFIKVVIARIYKKKIIYSHYARVNNFGDRFNNDLLNYFKTQLIYTSSYKKSQVALIGSILGSYGRDFKGYVLGSGFINNRYDRKENQWNIKIIRGPLSAEQAGLDNSSVLFADPGILSSKIHSITQKKKYTLGILPHSKDVELVKKLDFTKDVLFIHPRRKPIEVIKDINKCHYIASSSLHGLIFADSYRIPNVHLKFSEKLKGGFHKFNDYYLGMDSKPEYIEYASSLTLSKIISNCKLRYTDNYLEKKQKQVMEIFKKCINEIT